jgi:hypothetical protein
VVSEEHPSPPGVHNAVTATPEPGTWLLLGSGLVGIIGIGIRRKRLAQKV